jgi:hypothetical protein
MVKTKAMQKNNRGTGTFFYKKELPFMYRTEVPFIVPCFQNQDFLKLLIEKLRFGNFQTLATTRSETGPVFAFFPDKNGKALVYYLGNTISTSSNSIIFPNRKEGMGFNARKTYYTNWCFSELKWSLTLH